ncbi:hypothetical protein R1flu_019968 [Riccia fluitans]|uniref:Uncharacterized protein n=1 Tax=Riccia fluitans TaxID=41844 RepID=A0ABD1ZK58_9MARC
MAKQEKLSLERPRLSQHHRCKRVPQSRANKSHCRTNAASHLRTVSMDQGTGFPPMQQAPREKPDALLSCRQQTRSATKKRLKTRDDDE